MSDYGVVMPRKNERVSLRLDEESKQILERLAKHRQVGTNEVLRQLIREAEPNLHLYQLEPDDIAQRLRETYTDFIQVLTLSARANGRMIQMLDEVMPIIRANYEATHEQPFGDAKHG